MKKSKKEIQNPFTSLSFVWTSNKGLLYLTNSVEEIRHKPEFSFKYDSLYCEPTLIKKVIDSFDYDLKQKEIDEVYKWLEKEDQRPPLYNGVDGNGKYLERVDRDKIVRLVNYVPDAKNSWRMDLSQPGDNWVMANRIDKDGNNLGFGEELPEHTVVSEPPPEDTWGEVWKYDIKKGKWYDGRAEEEALKFVQEALLYRAYMHMNHILELKYVLHKEHKYGCDFATRTSILENVAVKFNGTRGWVPKGELEPVQLTWSDFKTISELINDVKTKTFDVYLQHKINIKNELDPEELKKYDVTTGYKDDTDKT
mgnify:CR=1 FL=1